MSFFDLSHPLRGLIFKALEMTRPSHSARGLSPSSSLDGMRMHGYGVCACLPLTLKLVKTLQEVNPTAET